MAKERLLCWLWIGISTTLIWFYVEAHWSVKATLIVLSVWTQLQSFGSFCHAEEVRNRLDHVLSSEFHALQAEVAALEEKVEKMAQKSAAQSTAW
jgi:hypothetical protein